ncbi:putative serine incorporator isoform 1 [Schistosoma japonicum]|uniref:Putative serine incorporator isoform 1 n=1 Tax=Schistosoma japonicum TaxID=6182 RepID=A0A4Z2CMR9_SCHJA|nr:putative serine incorporator isoform 1 [Schistosoma japonicum]
MGCIVSSVACCFCSSAASLCCSCLPSCKSSTSSRIMFAIILVITVLLSVIALIPSVREGLTKIPALCTPFKLSPFTSERKSVLDCDAITGFGAVYRICFASTMFFLLFCLIMIRVHSSADWRTKLQNGFWFFKFLGWFGLLIGAFFIPVEGFTNTWMVIGMIGGSLYILIQLILLVDFAHTWNENWLAQYEESGNKCYAVGLVFCTFFFSALSITGTILLYIFYAGASQCVLNKALISLNLISCFLTSVVSILPKVQEHMPQSGLLQSSIITAYVTFLTWSGLTNGQDPACNPSLTFTNSTDTQDSSVALNFDRHIVVGIIVLVLSVLYSTLRSSTNTSAGKFLISVLNIKTNSYWMNYFVCLSLVGYRRYNHGQSVF